MSWFQALLLIVYSLSLGLLMVFSLHRFAMVHLYYRNRRNLPPNPRPFE